ncbi:MAG: ribonucleoside-triphosphate reductase [Candidatus Pacebacteria bacterium]|nr:ribonucleoside-triphosphate reductase [Candidatus Paceibacterota bacterium]
MTTKIKSLKSVRKRDGTVVPFNEQKIVQAISKAMKASNEGNEAAAKKVAKAVSARGVAILKKAPKGYVSTVEEIQDLVEKELIFAKFATTAKSYILYRQRRGEARQSRGDVPEQVKKLTAESRQYFRSSMAEFVYFRSYSRWKEAEGRRETWVETVGRYIDFMKENLGNKLKEAEYEDLRLAILKQEVMPSMRLMWGAGKAARTSNAVGYNCSYIAPMKPRDLGEIMYLSMNGCGVGFSVETITAQEFPIIKRQNGTTHKTWIVEDSKEGWCNAFVKGMEVWFSGGDIDFDYSLVRPLGARLMTMGGRASGPGPLKELMAFSKAKILGRQGRRLTNLDLHDIICKVGEVVVAGGVRRTALISLSDLDDTDMRHAKDGQFYMTEPQRAMSNNSAVYVEKPTATQFMEEWLSLAKSGSGERGIFNRGTLTSQMPARRVKQWEQSGYIENGVVVGIPGTNPCGEIVLKSKQFCNLTEVVARATDNKESLLRKARLASILGTYQSTLTTFKYLSEEWKKNCEDERLLGVSITGQWDSEAVRRPEVLKAMKDEAVKANKEYAKRFGINQSTSVTCVKPSGTVSQTVDAASGMHPRHAKYYIRRVRISATDPLFQLMKDQGIPYHPEVGQTAENAHTFVLEFPMKAPSGSTFKDDLSAVDQLEYWKMVKENFTEHNPSVTISVGDDEWVAAGNWVYKNWEMVGGLSFLPREKHIYKLAPYEAIDEKTYKQLSETMKDIDFSKIVTYEFNDETQGSKEYACVGGTCEVDVSLSSLETMEATPTKTKSKKK